MEEVVISEFTYGTILLLVDILRGFDIIMNIWMIAGIIAAIWVLGIIFAAMVTKHETPAELVFWPVYILIAILEGLN